MTNSQILFHIITKFQEHRVMQATFIWVDLSTFNVERATQFYHKVFDWSFSKDPSDYTYCSLNGMPCAGLYEMPAFFQEIRMPSFWMTYISVSDVKAVASKATMLGGKVELEEETPKGRIALIRDPAGAGFTCYEGDELAAKQDFDKPGNWCWTELMVSDVSLVRDFYTTLFNWRLDAESTDRYAIKTSDGNKIGTIQVASKDVKGEKEFWAVYFAVPNIHNTMTAIKQAGGRTGGTYPHEYGTQGLAYDDQGAAFFMIQRDKPFVPSSRQHHGNQNFRNLKWRSMIGLTAVYLIVLLDQNWGWGLLFLFWILPDIKTGSTYFIEPLHRSSNPILYWAVVLTWTALSLYLLLEAIFQ